MIKVCDAIMGAGKSQAAIDMMNTHPNKKYIFITPYLTEATRIKESCPDLHFAEPSDRIKKHHFSKTRHTYELIESGRNIATTHQAFLYYTKETIDLIKQQEYTLVIDETVSVLESIEAPIADIEILVETGYLRKENDVYSWTGKEYNGRLAKDIMRVAKSRDLVGIEKSGSLKYNMFYWILPYRLFTAFSDIYVLTYLLRGQPLAYFMDMYGLSYEYIGVEPYEHGYRFCEYPGTMPPYVSELKSKIHMIENDKLNDVGDDNYALSISWFENNQSEVTKLKRNMSNYFNHRMAGIPAGQRMWGSHKSGQKSLQGKGYTKAYLAFNTRAVNEFRDKICLAYAINIFMNVGEKLFFQRAGIEVNEDAYALSIMIQWIWRSGIRDGEDIYLYLPSKRMRDILTRWLNSVTEGSVGVSA